MGNRAHLIILVIGAAALLLHGCMLHLLAGTNLMAVLLSPGGHMSLWAFFVALFFIFLRCAVIILLPGVILFELWSIAAGLYGRLLKKGVK